MEEPSVKIYLTDKNGVDYYFGKLLDDGSYILDKDIAPHPILTLPNGWQDTQIEWARDTTFLGVFTTQSQTFKFVKDAKGVLLNLYYAIGAGIQAECIMRVDIFEGPFTGYVTTYECEIDFSKVKDQKSADKTDGLGNPLQDGEFLVPTLNARLNELWAAYGDTEFNIPMWQNIGTLSVPVWVSDAKVIWHSGIKLRYEAAFQSSATQDNPLDYSTPSNQQLFGWNKGSGYNNGDGYHIVIPMVPFTRTQNNGSTTFIGNDILNTFLILGNQTPGAANFASENSFADTNHSQPSTKNNFSLKNLLENTPSGGFQMYASCNFQMNNKLGIPQGINYPHTAGSYMSFVLFEINNDDNTDVVAGKYVNPQEIYRITFPGTPGDYVIPINGLNNIANPNPVNIKYNKVYVIGIIADDTAGYGGSNACSFILSKFQAFISSKYDSGTSGVPISSPSFPGSPIMGFTADQLLQKIVLALNSDSTDPYGFPVIPSSTPFTGVSSFLSTDKIVYDNSPTRTLFFSSNALQLLAGYPFISMSLNKLFKFCFNTWGNGLGINGNTIGIESLGHYFQNVMICDLGTNVAKMTIEPLTDIMTCEIQTGYNTQNTNNDFGVDIYAKELDFTTPLSKVPGTTLSIVNSIIADMYAMEKRRAQQVNSAIPTSGNGQSNGNETYVVEFDPATTYPHTQNIPFPDGSGSWSVSAKVITQFAAAQSNNETLGTYVYGLFYPDTGLNYGLTPIKNLYRLGAYLRSMLDGFGGQKMAFRKIYQMLYNNVSELIPGIKTNNLYGLGGNVIQECADITISDLSATQYFRPYKISLETISPVNMWQIMKTNPNGYIRWTWKNEIWQGYVSKVNQNIALSKPTNYELWAHPIITNTMLINA